LEGAGNYQGITIPWENYTVGSVNACSYERINLRKLAFLWVYFGINFYQLITQNIQFAILRGLATVVYFQNLNVDSILILRLGGMFTLLDECNVWRSVLQRKITPGEIKKLTIRCHQLNKCSDR